MVAKSHIGRTQIFNTQYMARGKQAESDGSLPAFNATVDIIKLLILSFFTF